MNAIENVIDELKSSQTQLHLKVVKLIEQHSFTDVRSLIGNGEYSKLAYLHYSKEDTPKTPSSRGMTIAPGLREEDLSDDEEDEQYLTSEEIRQLTQMGYVDKDSLLHIAVKNQDLKLTKFLLDNGVDFNKKNRLDQTALHFIAISRDLTLADSKNSSTATASSTLASDIPGLSLNTSGTAEFSSSISPRSGGMSPRGISPRSGGQLKPREELLSMILEKKKESKININQIDKNGGFTALNLCARENEFDLVTKLVYEDAQVDVENDAGWTPMHYAIYNQNGRMLEILLKRGGGNLFFRTKRNVDKITESEASKYGNIKLEELKKYGKMSPFAMLVSLIGSNTRKLMNATLLNSFNERLATPGYKNAPSNPLAPTSSTANQSVLFTINNNPLLTKWLSIGKSIIGDNTQTGSIGLVTTEAIETHLQELASEFIAPPSDDNSDGEVKENLRNLLIEFVISGIQFHDEFCLEKCQVILKTLFSKVPKFALSRFDIGSTVSGMHSSSTFLHLAIRAKNMNAIPLILNANLLTSEELTNLVNESEKRAADSVEYTALHNCMLHCPPAASFLVDHGVDCQKRSGGKDLPIFLAVQCKDLPGHVGAKIVQTALENPSEENILNFSNSLGQSLLYFAAQNSQVELVKKLIEKGANSGAVTEGAETILSAAAYGGNVSVIEYLIDEVKLDPCGSYEESYTENSYPPIHAATKNGNLDAVKLLVEKYNVSVDQSRHDLQMRPIILCAISGRVDCAQYLIEKGCDCSVVINTREDKQLTPLHFAAGYGHPNVVKLLVENGNYHGKFAPAADSPLKVDISAIKTLNGVSPLEMAIKRVQLNVVKYLCEIGAVSLEQALQLAIQSDNTEIIGWIEKRLENDEKKSKSFLKIDVGGFGSIGVTAATPVSPSNDK